MELGPPNLHLHQTIDDSKIPKKVPSVVTFTGTAVPSLVLRNSPCRCCSIPATSQFKVWTSLHDSTVFFESYTYTDTYIYMYYIYCTNLRGTSAINPPQIIRRQPWPSPSLDTGHQHLTKATSLAYLGPNWEWLSTVHLSIGHQEMSRDAEAAVIKGVTWSLLEKCQIMF